jgi:hypothetical protein
VARGRRLVISALVAAAAAAGALLLVGGGSAGTGNYSFTVAAGPPTVSKGQSGFVVAKFQPDKGSGAASHTVITFTFRMGSVDGAPTPDTDSSPDCSAAVLKAGNWVITCNVGTVTPGKLVKRFVTFVGGTPTNGLDAGIGASVGFDNGSGKAKGGGAVNSPSMDAGVTVAAPNSNAAGACTTEGEGSVATTPIGEGVPQSTALEFGSTSEPVPCSWGTVSVLDSNRGNMHAPKISSVGGVLYNTPAEVTLSFVDLRAGFILQESENFDPNNPGAAVWTNVPDCDADPPLPNGADACIVSFLPHPQEGSGDETCDGDGDQDDIGFGCVTTYHLLYRGSNAGPAGGTDPWFN